jgi:hypothetical protein
MSCTALRCNFSEDLPGHDDVLEASSTIMSRIPQHIHPNVILATPTNASAIHQQSPTHLSINATAVHDLRDPHLNSQTRESSGDSSFRQSASVVSTLNPNNTTPPCRIVCTTPRLSLKLNNKLVSTRGRGDASADPQRTRAKDAL